MLFSSCTATSCIHIFYRTSLVSIRLQAGDWKSSIMHSVNPVLFDCIVAGSGPAGTMCAQTLLEGGLSVLMIDGGLTASFNTNIDTATLHHYKTATTEEEVMPDLQASLVWKKTSAAEQLTIPRRYVVEGT